MAAVAGRRVPHRLLVEVAGQPEADLEQGLREAIGAGVLATDAARGSYAFRHALLQEAVDGDLLPGEQVRLHAAYARLLPPSRPARRRPPRTAGRPRPVALAAGVAALAAGVGVLAARRGGRTHRAGQTA